MVETGLYHREPSNDHLRIKNRRQSQWKENMSSRAYSSRRSLFLPCGPSILFPQVVLELVESTWLVRCLFSSLALFANVFKVSPDAICFFHASSSCCPPFLMSLTPPNNPLLCCITFRIKISKVMQWTLML